MATDKHAALNAGLHDPFVDGLAITTSDTLDLTYVTRGIYVGGAGDVTLITQGGTTLTFKAVPVGTVLNVRATRVKATLTTATNLIGLV